MKVIDEDCVVVQNSANDAAAGVPDGWLQTRFGNCAVLVRDTISPAEHPEMPYVGLEHIGVGTLSLLDTGVASAVNSAKSRFRCGDVLFGKLRPYFRKVTRARIDGICSTDIWVVRPTDGVDAGYLFYVMASQDFVEAATQGSEGTRMPRAKWEYMARREVSLPPLPEQRAIAHVLGTLDDKIELNRRMNQTLDEMARAIFKSWFVDFHPVLAKIARRDTGLPPDLAALFPDRLVDSELGDVPEGWEVRRLGDFGNVITGKTPSTRNPIYYGDDVPFLKIPDMHGKVYVVETGTMLSNEGASSQPKKALPAGSVSVSCIATPGLVVLNHRMTHTNQQINSIIPSANWASKYLYWSCRHLSAEIMTGGSGGSVFGNMNKSAFSELAIPGPEDSAVLAFDRLVSPLHDAILSNECESHTLAALRDALLPRLVSGEVRQQDVCA